MTDIERTTLIEKFSAMDIEQMQAAIQAFPIEVVFNELERREKQRIELIGRVDELTAFMSSITR